MLEIKNLSKNYGSKEAVKNINITIKPGEIYGFLGHNGAGKTTTIKVCVGLLKATEGTVKICGHDINKEALNAKSKFGYVPDDPYLYEKLTGREFLELMATVHFNKIDKDIEKTIDDLIKKLRLNDEGDKLIESYSHGMRKKITLCAAFLHKPEVLFLDEPTSGLDAATAKIAKDLFRKSADDGAAILFTTHVLEIAEKICDKIGIISQGELIAEGTLEELRKKFEKSGESLEDIFLNITENSTGES